MRFVFAINVLCIYIVIALSCLLSTTETSIAAITMAMVTAFRIFNPKFSKETLFELCRVPILITPGNIYSHVWSVERIVVLFWKR